MPWGLVGFRVAAAPAVLMSGATGRGGWIAALIVLATLSDVFDGIVARGLGVATEWLRQADTLADTVFWLAMLPALWLLRPDAMVANGLIIAAAAGQRGGWLAHHAASATLGS